MPTLEDMDALLDGTCMSSLGDTFEYRAAGSIQFESLRAYVTYAGEARPTEVASVMDQAHSVEVLVADVPVKPSKGARVKLPKVAGKVFRPINVRLTDSGTHWFFELEGASADD